MKWKWFVGGKAMFWSSIVIFVIFIVGFIFTYIIDPTTVLRIKIIRDMDITTIKNISNNYINELGIKIDKPIIYRLVDYRYTKNSKYYYYGTFHEWNDKYYIDICANLTINSFYEKDLKNTVKHETRHMIVEYMKDKNIIDLTEYTEEIAREENDYYNNLFNSGIYLLKELQNGHTY